MLKGWRRVFIESSKFQTACVSAAMSRCHSFTRLQRLKAVFNSSLSDFVWVKSVRQIFGLFSQTDVSPPTWHDTDTVEWLWIAEFLAMFACADGPAVFEVWSQHGPELSPCRVKARRRVVVYDRLNNNKQHVRTLTVNFIIAITFNWDAFGYSTACCSYAAAVPLVLCSHLSVESFWHKAEHGIQTFQMLRSGVFGATWLLNLALVVVR